MVCVLCMHVPCLNKMLLKRLFSIVSLSEVKRASDRIFLLIQMVSLYKDWFVAPKVFNAVFSHSTSCLYIEP